MSLTADLSVIRLAAGDGPVARYDRIDGSVGSAHRTTVDRGRVVGAETALLMLHVSDPSDAMPGARILLNGHHVGTISRGMMARGAPRTTYVVSFAGRLLRDVGNRIGIVHAVEPIAEPANGDVTFEVLDAVCLFRQRAS